MQEKALEDNQIKNASAEDLIRAFSPWLWRIVHRYRDFFCKSGVYDGEDLYWTGAMALIDAQKTWDPDLGSFMSYSFNWIRSAMRKELCFDKRIAEPSFVYLDAPLPEDEEHTLKDIIPSGEKGPEEIMEDGNLHDQVEAALERLTDHQQKTILKKQYYEERTVEEIAAVLGIEAKEVRSCHRKAIHSLRQDSRLKRILVQDYCRRVGITEFKSTMISEVELAVIRMENAYNTVNGPGAYLHEKNIIKKHIRGNYD